MLAAVEGIVVDEEVVLAEILEAAQCGTGLERVADGSQLKRNELGLSHHVTVAVQQRRGAVRRLTYDG